MTIPVPETESGSWELIRSKTPEGTKLSKQLTHLFHRLYPKGHEESLQQFTLMAAAGVRSGHFNNPEFNGYYENLLDFDPAALDIIARYGIDYTPVKYRTPPCEEPVKAACFGNAWDLARHDSTGEMVYVEGIVHGVYGCPMLHAWNALGIEGAVANDWTLYAGTHWLRYRGIPLTLEEQDALLALTPKRGRIALLFKKGTFTSEAKAQLLTILKKRKRKRTKAAQ